MKKLKMICLALLMIHFISASTTETIAWKSSNTLSSWEGQLSIGGNKWGKVRADDVQCLSITAQNGAHKTVCYRGGETSVTF